MNQLVVQEDRELKRIDISPEEESKLQALLDQKRLPTVFTLHGVRIESDSILGFFEKLTPASNPFEEPVQQTLNDKEDIFAKVRASDWYQRGLKARQSPPKKRVPQSFGVPYSPYA